MTFTDIPTSWKLDDGTYPPDKKYFEKPLFNKSARIFTGSLTWSPVAFWKNRRWDSKLECREGFLVCTETQMTTFESGLVQKDTNYGYRFYKVIGKTKAQLEVQKLKAMQKKPSEPRAPKTKLNGSNIVITWTKPPENGSLITSYKVFIQKSD